MKEGEQSPQELGYFDDLFEPLGIEQRTLNDFQQDVVVPFGVIPALDNLDCQPPQNVADLSVIDEHGKVFVVDLHAHTHLHLLDLALATQKRILHGVGPAGQPRLTRRLTACVQCLSFPLVRLDVLDFVPDCRWTKGQTKLHVDWRDCRTPWLARRDVAKPRYQLPDLVMSATHLHLRSVLQGQQLAGHPQYFANQQSALPSQSCIVFFDDVQQSLPSARLVNGSHF